MHFAGFRSAVSRLAGVVAIALLGWSAYVADHPPVLFQDRNLTPPDPGNFSLGTMVWDDEIVPASVRKQYEKLDPQKSLLVSDCGTNLGWCSDSFTSFDLPGVFQMAAGIANLSPEDATDRWFRAAIDSGAFSANDAFTSPTLLGRFQKLAVVNRLDLAARTDINGGKGPLCRVTPADGMWQCAELRFVYGLRPGAEAVGAPSFTLIVEFVLPDMTWSAFRDYALRWKELSRICSVAGPECATAYALMLQGVVAGSGYNNASIVRLRMNRSDDTGDLNGTTWKFAQWEFRNKAVRGSGVSFGQTQLDNQADRRFTKPPNPYLPDYAELKRGYDKYLTLWNPGPESLKSGVLEIPAALLSPLSPLTTYTNPADPVLTAANPENKAIGLAIPADVSGDAAFATRVRNLMALDQCTHCHSGETATAFTHISNRMPTEASALSRFLVGKEMKPSVYDLLNHADNVALSFCLNYCAPGTGAGRACPNSSPMIGRECPGEKIASVDRKFHDVARRMLFLSSLLAAPANPNKSQQRRIAAEIERYKANFPD